MEEKLCCDYLHIHDEIVEKVEEKMLDEETLYDLSELYRAFSDSTRIKILYVISVSSMCVCDIAKVLNMTVSAISHQLKVLKNAKLIKCRKEGKSVFYSLDDEHVVKMLDNGIEHIKER